MGSFSLEIIKQLLNKDPRFRKILSDLDGRNELEDHLEDIFQKMAPYIRIISIRNRCLYLGVKNPIWSQEVLYLKNEFIEKINQFLPKKKWINSIQCRVEERVLQPKKALSVKLSGEGLVDKIRSFTKAHSENGERLCIKCQKTYTNHSICRLCELKG